MSNSSNFISKFSVQDFTSQHQVDFYTYWLSIKGERSLPARADIYPADIVKILPHIIIFEKTEGDFFVRLMGTKCAEILGESTGKSLLSNDAGREAIKRFKWCAENKKPYYHIKPLDKFNKKHVNSSAIVMPLSENDNDVNMIILVHHFY